MLLTQFYKQGSDTPAKMPHGWGWWHVSRFYEAYEAEGHHEFHQWEAEDGVICICGEEEEAPCHVRLASLTEYVYTERHEFTDESDGEVLTIEPGDTFRWWRDR